MIRAHLRAKPGATAKDLVLLGLEDDNLTRLMGGQPIRVNLRDLDPDGPPTDLPDIDVLIFHATPERMAELTEMARAAMGEPQ